ncbi:hypothetical protein IW143_005744 [Coemansia sp. RSA 520]|nr:hypothetical protein IW143_005744 [Coemansia sp. RSA 520]
MSAEDAGPASTSSGTLLGVAQAQQRTMARRTQIAAEILDTERTYVDGLALIEKVKGIGPQKTALFEKQAGGNRSTMHADACLDGIFPICMHSKKYLGCAALTLPCEYVFV